MIHNKTGEPILVRGLTRISGMTREKGLNQARKVTSRAVAHVRSGNISHTPATAANTHGDNSKDNGDGDGSEEGGGGDDDDPSTIACSPPIIYHFTFPSHFLSCLLLVGTSWLFKESFLAAIPLIGLCALCAFPDKLQFLRGEASPQGAKFEMRGKK